MPRGFDGDLGVVVVAAKNFAEASDANDLGDFQLIEADMWRIEPVNGTMYACPAEKRPLY